MIDVARARADTPGCRGLVHFNNAGAALPTARTLRTQLEHLELEARIGGYEAQDDAAERIQAIYDSIATVLWKSLKLTGDEVVSIGGLAGDLKPRSIVQATITRPDGKVETIDLLCRIDTEIEIEYVEHGGVLHYVLRNLAKS